MQPSLEETIAELRSRFWSDEDPEGRVFVPLADAYRRAGELDEAAELVEDGLSRHPDLTPGHLVAARVHRDRGDGEAARDAYRRVLVLDPENTEALRELADLAEEAGRTAKARELYHRLALQEPDAGDARDHLRRLKEEHFRDVLEDPEPVSEQEPVEEEPVEEEAVEEEAVEEEAVAGEPFEEEPAAAAPVEAGPMDDVPEGEPPLPSESGPEDEAPSEPAFPEGDDDDEGEQAEVYTRTMAELYVRQGLWDRAEEVYERLLEVRPDDESLRERLEEVRARQEPGGAADAAAEAPSRPPTSSAGEAGAREEVEVEDLARDWASGPDETGELDTPFAWSEEEGADEVGAAGEDGESEVSIGAYFGRLLGEEAEEAGEDAEADGAPSGPPGVDDEVSGEPPAEADEADDENGSDDDFDRWLEGLSP